MARLASKEKMGYYRTQPEIVEILARMIEFHPRNTILDLFCGQGEACYELQRFNVRQEIPLKTYGVELNEDRAKQARMRMDWFKQGAAETMALKDPDIKFDFQLYNPPYDNVGKTRLEVMYLEQAAGFMVEDGIFVAIVPKTVAESSAFLDAFHQYFYLSGFFKYPEPTHQEFKQVVLFGKRREDSESDVYTYILTRDTQHDMYSHWPILGETPFTVSTPEPLRKKPQIVSAVLDIDIINAALSENYFETDEWVDISIPKTLSRFTPLTEPREGHLALLLAAGMIDNVQIGGYIIKGRYEKDVELIKPDADTDDTEASRKKRDKEKDIARESIIQKLTLLDVNTGEISTLDSAKQPKQFKAFIQRHMDDLFDAVKERYVPLYRGDYSRFEHIFNKLHAPQPLPHRPDLDGPIEVQKHIAAAMATMMLETQQRIGIINGDMGTGKTITSLTAAAAVGAKHIVIMCPPHLTKQWQFEIEGILKDFNVEVIIGRKISDVEKAFRRTEGITALVLSQSAAKLGAKWEPAFMKKKLIEEVKIVDQSSTWNQPEISHIEKRVITRAHCAACGKMHPLHISELLEIKPGTKTVHNLMARCPYCKTPMFQYVPFVKGGRWALANYIRKRWSRHYFLIIDEAHDTKARSTYIGQAAQHLMQHCKHGIIMTGTMFNGIASSLFFTLFRTSPSFRDAFPTDGEGKFSDGYFVDLFGMREYKIDGSLDVTTTANGYKQVRAKSSKEIPGIAPGIVEHVLPISAFMYTTDVSEYMPNMEEFQLPIDIPVDDPLWDNLRILEQIDLRENFRATSKWLQVSLGHPDHGGEEHIYNGHTLVAHLPQLNGSFVPHKNFPVVKAIKSEASHGRGSLVFMSQVNVRDPIPLLSRMLTIAGVKHAILRSQADWSTLPNGELMKVKKDERGAFADKCTKMGGWALLCSPQLVQTGLNLVDYPTVVWYSPQYDPIVVNQASCRPARLTQDKTVKVIYVYHKNTLQEACIERLSAKSGAMNTFMGTIVDGMAALSHTKGLANELLELKKGVTTIGFPKYTPPVLLPIRPRSAYGKNPVKVPTPLPAPPVEEQPAKVLTPKVNKTGQFSLFG